MGNMLISISIYILIDDQMEICWNIFISTLATDEPSKSFLGSHFAKENCFNYDHNIFTFWCSVGWHSYGFKMIDHKEQLSTWLISK